MWSISCDITRHTDETSCSILYVSINKWCMWTCAGGVTVLQLEASSCSATVWGARRVHLGLRHTVRRRRSDLTFRPSRAPESRGTLPSFMRLLSKMRPIRRSPSLDGCHVTGCYKVRATTHLLFNDSSTWIWLKQTTVHGERGKGGAGGEYFLTERSEFTQTIIDSSRLFLVFDSNMLSSFSPNVQNVKLRKLIMVKKYWWEISLKPRALSNISGACVNLPAWVWSELHAVPHAE